MKPHTLNEYLSNGNPWTARLLGREPFRKKRDEEQTEREYNKDKYGRLVDLDLATIDEFKAREFQDSGAGDDDEIPVSFGDELFLARQRVIRQIYYGVIKATVARYPSDLLCELGCGYGYNFSYMGRPMYGGEFSENAVKLGRRLGLDIAPFNYYQRSDYQMIRPGSNVVTVHSVEQIPDATCLIEGLASVRDRVGVVLHFEPTVVAGRTSLLGLLRNRYMELNDYNRNLLDALQRRPDVEILETAIDVMGLNPLNSTNVVAWRFRPASRGK